METYILNIEFINRYLNNTLSISEQEAFQSRLKSEPNFAKLFAEQQALVNGMRRSQLKNIINNAEKAFLKRQLIKKGLYITGASILTGIAIWFAVSKSDKTTETPTSVETMETTVETLESKSVVTEKLPTSNTDSSKTKNIVLGTLVSSSTTNSEPDTSVVQFKEAVADSVIPTGYLPLIKKWPMTLPIDAQKENTVFGNKGTKLVFMANSFVDPQGNPVQGEVIISLNEFYGLDDMILGNLSTSADGKLLETGGMIHVEATQNQQQLQLSKPMEVTFGQATKLKNMQLFSGNEQGNGINWKLASLEGKAIVAQDLLEDEIASVPFAVIEEVPVFPGCEGTEEEKRICTQDALSKFVQRKFNADACLANLEAGSNRVFASFSISKEGKITNIRTRAQSNCLQDATKKALESVPQMQPGKQRGRVVEVLYSLPMTYTVIGESEVSQQQNSNFIIPPTSVRTATAETFDTIVSYTRTPIEKLKEILHDNEIEITDAMLQEYDSYKKKKLIRNTTIKDSAAVILRKQLFEIPNTYFKRLETDSVSRGGHAYRIPWGADQIPDKAVSRVVPINRNTNMNEYAFTTMSMGWLNLDRFVNSSLPLKKFKVKIKDAQGASVKLVFKNYRSLLNSRETEKSVFTFGDVPEGQTVKIIAIQKSQDGTLFMGSKEVQTEDLEALDLSFKKYELKDLKRELRRVSNAFRE